MREPRRLYDESESELERALLHAGTSYRSSRRARAKTLAALGLAGSAIMATGTAAASLLSPLAKMGWTKLVVAVTALGAVTAVPVGYKVYRAHQASAVVTPRAAVAVADRRATPSRSETFFAEGDGSAPVAPRSPAAAVNVRTARMDGRHARLAGGSAARSGAGAAGGVTLTQELASLDAVRSSLANGNPQAALFLLDAYARTCPQGRLAPESELLRMDALARSGQTKAARRCAADFLRRHPQSVLAPRARGYLND